MATSTVSTRSIPSRLLKSDPPPNNQMSLPGAAFLFATVSLALSETVTPGQSDCRNARDSTYACIPGIAGAPPCCSAAS